MTIALGPKKLIDKLVDDFVYAIEHGMTLTKSCQLAGISYDTYLKWRRLGEDDRERGVDNEYTRFLVRIEQAEARFAIDRMDQITRANVWTAHAWVLEHRFPADFGTRQVVEMGGIGGGPIQTVDLAALSQLSVEELLVLEKAKRVIDGQNNANGSPSTERLPYTPRSLPS